MAAHAALNTRPAQPAAAPAALKLHFSPWQPAHAAACTLHAASSRRMPRPTGQQGSLRAAQQLHHKRSSAAPAAVRCSTLLAALQAEVISGRHAPRPWPQHGSAAHRGRLARSRVGRQPAQPLGPQPVACSAGSACTAAFSCATLRAGTLRLPESHAPLHSRRSLLRSPGRPLAVPPQPRGRSRSRASGAARMPEPAVRGRQEEIEDEELAAPARPRLQPFVPQSDVRAALLSYCYEVPVAGGRLVVQPISARWLCDATELLTESFGDAMGYLPVYKNFLRRQVRGYLERHTHLPPRAIVLVAIFHPLQLNGLAPSGGDSNSSRSGGTEPLQATSSGGSADSCAGSAGAADTAVGSSSSSSSDAGTPDSSGSSGRDGARGREEPGAVLVGTCELSFDEGTRSRYLTLNSPPDEAYACNVAVEPAFRRRGCARHMMLAAEEVARMVGQRNIYLHLRFKDAAPAALYRQMGYQRVKQDTPLVLLLGQDRRYLLAKALSEPDSA